MFFELKLLPFEYCAVRMNPESLEEALPLLTVNEHEVQFLAVSNLEVSWIGPKKLIEALKASHYQIEAPFRCFRLEGTFEFSEVGIIKTIVEPLAEISVPVLTQATYDTDFILIPSAHLEEVVEVWIKKGMKISR